MKSEVDGGSGGSDMICEFIHMNELTTFHRQSRDGQFPMGMFLHT